MLQEVTLYPATTAATAVTGSSVLLLNEARTCFIQWLITGADVAGTFTVEVSADNSVWTAWATGTAVTSSADGHINMVDCGAKYARFTWAYTSGTGNLSVKAVIKGGAKS